MALRGRVMSEDTPGFIARLYYLPAVQPWASDRSALSSVSSSAKWTQCFLHCQVLVRAQRGGFGQVPSAQGTPDTWWL